MTHLTAEARGFEPRKGFKPLNALAVRSLRPLGHASVGNHKAVSRVSIGGSLLPVKEIGWQSG